MARKAVSCAVAYPTIDGIRQVGNSDDPVNTVSTAATAAAIAVLVADGASPTQGHVDTLATAWATLLAGTAPIPGRSDVLISYNTTAVGTKSVLREALRRLVAAAEGNDGLTS